MAYKNMTRREEIAKTLRERRGGNSNHPRWGKTGLRISGNIQGNHFVTTLTVPAKCSQQVADAYERDQQYTCEVRPDGTIVFHPIPEAAL